jgi:hypothetical protein
MWERGENGICSSATNFNQHSKTVLLWQHNPIDNLRSARQL